jgi:hypothetical protein
VPASNLNLALTPSQARFLLSPEATVTCPHCEREFALAAGFAKKALETVEENSARALATLREEERAGAERQARKIAEERDAVHAKALAAVRGLTEEAFRPQVEALKSQLQEMQAQTAQRSAAEREAYEKRLAEQQTRVQALQAEQVSLREERQKLRDEKASMALDVQRQVDARLGERDNLIRAQEQERSQLDKAELQKKIDDVTAKLTEAQAKASQGSQQLQGEVLELAIEEDLRRAFPLDVVEEVKKGQRGGDVVQRVMTRTGQLAGVILWETKRAKDWSPQWTAKLKEDMRGCGAAVGILVTLPGALPKDWPGSAMFAPYDDCWVTHHSTARGVAEILRAGLIDLHRQRAASAGKGEKMEALYDYLTSPQFALKLKAVYETFTRMREELESERNVTLQRWARREKQLQGGVTQLLGIGGEIQALAQQEPPSLELEPPPGEDS